MGLDANGTKFVIYAAKRRGVDLSKTATLGRQSLSVDAETLSGNFALAGADVGLSRAREIIESGDGYCEEFLRELGAAEIDSFDASEYENATVRHDMNREVPTQYRARYTAVLDGGTLEHVFNYPTALRNALEMTRPGGHFLAITPTNNFTGHGFYQFSPELFYSALGNENGFEIADVLMFEDYPGSPWYRVADPRAVRRRVTMANMRPAYLLVIARRIAAKKVFETFPQQSDYEAAWTAEETAENSLAGTASLTARITNRIKRAVYGPQPDPALFEKFDPFLKP